MAAHVPRSFTQEAEAFRTYCHRQFESDLDYNFDSVAILDGILNECYESIKGMNENEAWTFLNNMCLAAGAFLGEVLVRTCAATWRVDGNPGRLQSWSVAVPSGAGRKAETVPVFYAVYSFLLRGPAETLLGLVAPFLNAKGRWPTARTPARRAAVAAPRRR